MKTSSEGRTELARAVRARHGVDPLGSLAMRARFDLALAELPDAGEAPWLDPAVLDAIASRLRVGETRFYRDGAQLEAVADAVLRRALDAGGCRVLSAGCSTGEEVWTLALMLDALAGGRSVAWEVLGVDVDPVSIEQARAFRYSPATIVSLPPRLRRRVRVRDGAPEIDPAIVARCRFEVRDLLARVPLGPFDAVFCRNVLVYLEEDVARGLLGRLVSLLAPGGALVVARAEVAIARRAGLAGEEIGANVVVFRRPGGRREHAPEPSRDAIPIEPPPPSRVRLVVRPDDDERSIAARARDVLAGGAPVIEITIVGPLGDERRDRIGPAIRRLAAAARALRGRLSPSDDATARALAALGIS